MIVPYRNSSWWTEVYLSLKRKDDDFVMIALLKKIPNKFCIHSNSSPYWVKRDVIRFHKSKINFFLPNNSTSFFQIKSKKEASLQAVDLQGEYANCGSPISISFFFLQYSTLSGEQAYLSRGIRVKRSAIFEKIRFKVYKVVYIRFVRTFFLRSAVQRRGLSA